MLSYTGIIILSGDRNWTDKECIQRVLTQYVGQHILVFHGGCRGADIIGGEVCASLGISCMAFALTPNDWRQHGKGAGPMRNQQMLNEALSYMGNDKSRVHVIAFHNNITESKGTKHMLEIAQKAGINTYLYTNS